MIQAVNMQKMSVGIPRNKINQKSRSTQPNFKGAPTGDIDKLIEKLNYSILTNLIFVVLLTTKVILHHKNSVYYLY